MTDSFIRHLSLGRFMGKKILVVDDSPTVRKVAESLLKKQGYEVFCAEDGTSALGLARTNKPDLVFCDASLPVLDGHSVCEELKGNDELKDIPLIMLLTKDQVEKQKELVRMGVDAFLVKPFNPKDILKKVEESLNGENTNFKDEMRTEPKDELAPADEKLSIDKTEQRSTFSKKEKKKDGSLDILETSDFLASLGAPPSGSDATEEHGFDWFMSEMKKEMEETEQENLRKKDKKEKRDKTYQIDKDQKGYKDFLGKLKRELKEPQVEESPEQKIPPINYDKMIQDLIERVSTKIAQEVAKKIDPEDLKEMLRNRIKELEGNGI